MKYWFQASLVWLMIAISAPAGAGEVIGFVNSNQSGRVVVIPNSTLRALIAEFLDPAATGIGQSLGYLVWRETLTAISDQAKAGVILARAPEGQDLTALIGNRYHLAALEIAEFQKAAMILWGAVIENPDGELVINTHLTLRPTELLGAELTLRYTAGGLEGGLQTSISRNKFNFATVTRTRKDLFNRTVVTRQVANVRVEPSRQAEKVTQVPAGTVVQAIDMEGAWFKVLLRDGTEGFIENSLLDVPPRQIEVAKKNINLRAGPGTDHGIVATRDVAGVFDVRNMTYREGQGLWYQIRLDGKTVWIYAALTRPRYALPAVHFLAGLYRYYAGRFKDASNEFTQFIGSGEEGLSVNLAAGYQLLGASEVMGKSDFELDESIVDIFSRAVDLTPYDPSAYNLRALASIAVNNNLDQAIADLKVSTELDQTNKSTALLAKDLDNVVNQRVPGNQLLLRKLDPNDRQLFAIDKIAGSVSR